MAKNKEREIIVYQKKDGAIELRGDFGNETIWATQNDLTELFEKDQSVISRHIRNLFKDGEVDQKSNMQKMHIANSDKPVAMYSLDVILAVGYRTNSAKAIEFRQWATKIIKQHITEGYTINPKVIVKNHAAFLEAVENIQKLLPVDTNISTESILELVKSFSDTWFSLESYDEDRFPEKGFTKKLVKVQSADLYDDVAVFKQSLRKKKQASELFAQEKNKGALEGILGNVVQKAFGKEMYPSVEQKAVHLLYFVVKNHPFTDGNKRTGAFAFVWFLEESGIKYRHKITPEALTAMTLLVAESKPKEMQRIIGLILLLLKK